MSVSRQLAASVPAAACAAVTPESHVAREVMSWRQGELQQQNDCIAEEVPIALSYNGLSHAVMMATPKDLDEFGLGFSLTEGILAHPDELYDIRIMPQCDGIEVELSIAARRFNALKMRRRNLTGRTGCGLCGAESLQQAIRPVASVAPVKGVSPEVLYRALGQMEAHQHLKKLTGAVHGAAWCREDGEVLLLREDVGRHNALDKLIGAIYQRQLDRRNGFVLVTSRASYEMVHKTLAAGISVLAAVSAPTALAVRLAESSGMTLVGLLRDQRHRIYTGI